MEKDTASTVDAVGSSAEELRPQRRTMLHLAVFTAIIVLPIGLLPYLAARRKTNALQRGINEYASTIDKLQRELNTLKLDRALKRDEHAKIRSLITEMKQETGIANAELKRDINRLRAEADRLSSTHSTDRDALRSDICNKLADAR